MSGTPGPFKVIAIDGSGEVEKPVKAPIRRYSCDHYSACLNITAALNWDNFSCCSCNGEINEALNWQAHIAQKRDGVADRICEIPPIELYEPDTDETKVVNIVGKRTHG
jgi:hypothetical protein